MIVYVCVCVVVCLCVCVYVCMCVCVYMCVWLYCVWVCMCVSGCVFVAHRLYLSCQIYIDKKNIIKRKYIKNYWIYFIIKRLSTKTLATVCIHHYNTIVYYSAVPTAMTTFNTAFHLSKLLICNTFFQGFNILKIITKNVLHITPKI